MNFVGRVGLSMDEAKARLAQFGSNRIFQPAPVRFWAIASVTPNPSASVPTTIAPNARVLLVPSSINPVLLKPMAAPCESPIAAAERARR